METKNRVFPKPTEKPTIYDPGGAFPHQNSQRLFYNTMDSRMTLNQIQSACRIENKNIEIKRYSNQLLLLKTSRN
jgi:hypothetical protein